MVQGHKRSMADIEQIGGLIGRHSDWIRRRNGGVLFENSSGTIPELKNGPARYYRMGNGPSGSIVPPFCPCTKDGTLTLIWRILRALCGDDGAAQQWLAVIDYVVAENRVLREQLSAAGRRMCLTDEQRGDLAVLERALKPALRPYTSSVIPETAMARYRRLVAARYDSSKGRKRRPGRPPTAQTLKDLVCRIGCESPSWGYTCIRDQLYHFWPNIGRTTIMDILHEAGLTPEPERNRQRT